MKKILITFTFFLLSACTVKADFMPERENLNDAIVGVPYYSQINIFGGRVLSYNIDGGQVIAGDISPEDTGLHVQYCDEHESNNCLKIRGVPIKAGIVRVRVSGGIAGSLFSNSGEFDKTYTIRIKNSEVSR